MAIIQRNGLYLESPAVTCGPGTPMAVQVPKEYVRQQLKSMGIQEVTDEELDSYTTGIRSKLSPKPVL